MAKAGAVRSESLYGVHPGVAMVQKWVSELEEKTGRSLEEWIDFVKKEKLRPIYDALLRLGKSLGEDVKACPCKTIVPLYREHVFAQIKPTTNTRIDLGLALRNYKGKLPKRVIDTGGLAKKDRITQRIPVGSVDEIDAEMTKWLKPAYDLDI